MLRIALLLSGTLAAACFVDTPPAGTAASAAASSSTASDTTSAGTSGASTTGEAVTVAASGGSSGASATSGATSGGSTLASPESSTSGSSSDVTSTSTASGSTGPIVPPECPETADEYACTACCAEAHSGAKTFFSALAPCLCVIGEGCLLPCADLCEGSFPNELCYTTCVLMPPDPACGDEAVTMCAETPACAAFIDCYNMSDCANKP